MRGISWLAVGLGLLAGCAHRPQRLELDPIVITAGSKEDLELASLTEEELFALGTSAFAAQDFDKAARCFSRLADTFLQSPHRAEAQFNAGLSYERLAKFDLALERFLPMMDPSRGTGDALDAAFRAAECYYHLDRYRDAIDILTKIAARPDVPVQDRLQAKVQRGICLIEDGKLEEAESALRESITWWEDRQQAERLDSYFPSQAQFFLGEIYRLHFDRVVLDPDKGEAQLGKDLEYKCELLLSAQGHYLRSIRMGEGQWATASGFRIGALYETLYDGMINSKVPAGLDAEQTQVYREEVRKRIRVLVTKAMSIYEGTLAAAERMGVENPFIQQTRKSLDRIKQILLEDSRDSSAEVVPAGSSPGSDGPPRS